ncbi:hypothetical protein HNR14_000954 [Leifsonia naganoensis]|uniref:Uncharacterized protein n=1 Tax=Leifsonia naganoensis TaxID=150025 RepID=A0A853DN84_9MICO|nr:hypothetical protein [Leifsonia naganoensis]
MCSFIGERWIDRMNELPERGRVRHASLPERLKLTLGFDEVIAYLKLIVGVSSGTHPTPMRNAHKGLEMWSEAHWLDAGAIAAHPLRACSRLAGEASRSVVMTEFGRCRLTEGVQWYLCFGGEDFDPQVFL